MGTYVNGKAIRVYDLDATVADAGNITEAELAAADVIGCAKSASISMSNSVIDVTCQGNANTGAGKRRVIPGQSSWTASVETLYSVAQDAGIAKSGDLQAKYDAGTPVYLVVGDAEDDGATAGEVDGNYYWHGLAYISSIEVSATPGELVTYNISFEGDGDLTYGEFAASA